MSDPALLAFAAYGAAAILVAAAVFSPPSRRTAARLGGRAGRR
jgi:hypothetical protein